METSSTPLLPPHLPGPSVLRRQWRHDSGPGRFRPESVSNNHIFFETQEPIEAPLNGSFVKTLVVSWNDAADKKLSVAKEALVILRESA